MDGNVTGGNYSTLSIAKQFPSQASVDLYMLFVQETADQPPAILLF